MRLEGQQREKYVGQQVGLHLTTAAYKERKNVAFITRLIMPWLKLCNPHTDSRNIYSSVQQSSSQGLTRR